MRISEWKKHFAKKIQDRKNGYKNGGCYELSGDSAVEKQLSKIKGGGNHKIFYLEAETTNENEINLKLISETIYVDEPQY